MVRISLHRTEQGSQKIQQRIWKRQAVGKEFIDKSCFAEISHTGTKAFLFKFIHTIKLQSSSFSKRMCTLGCQYLGGYKDLSGFWHWAPPSPPSRTVGSMISIPVSEMGHFSLRLKTGGQLHAYSQQPVSRKKGRLGHQTQPRTGGLFLHEFLGQR